MPRLAIAFCVSLLAHAGLVGLFWLPVRPSANRARTDDGPLLRVRVEGWVPPRAVPVVKREDYIDAKVEPGVHLSPIVSPLPADPPGGTDTGSRRQGIGTRRGGDGLLAAPASARRVVWLIDRSISMGPSGGLDRARRELREALDALPPDALFQVMVYNQGVEPVRAAGTAGLLLADPATIGQVLQSLGDFPASGGTNHLAALRAALYLRPETLFLVTDADDLSDALVREITRLNASRSRIDVVELSRHGRADSPLARLARLNGGTHRRVPPAP